MNVFKHLKKVIKHKYWVAHYCILCGQIWRGLIHDISKFSPTEFIESAAYYTGDKSPVEVCKEVNGYSKALLHHIGHNDHHYQYWVDNYDKGCRALRMPFECVVEMVCDYIGAGKAYWGTEYTFDREYDYIKERHDPATKIMMHKDTIKFVDVVFTCCKNIEAKYLALDDRTHRVQLDEYLNSKILNNDTLHKLYEDIKNDDNEAIDKLIASTI